MAKKVLSENLIRKLDKDNMLGLLIAFPKQLKHAMTIGKIASIAKRYKTEYKNIVFLGLGGSAIGADLIRSYLVDECPLPIHVVRDYSIPKFIDKDTLVFAVSYSGNTEETLSMYNEAKSRKANIAVITSGGKLEDLARKNNNLLITIPKGYPPRCAVGYSFVPALVILSRLSIIGDKSKEIEEAALNLTRLLKSDTGPDSEEALSEKIAYKIYDKFTVIYSASKHIDVAATRWRGQLAENAKALSSVHVYPELNHNEVVGWDNPGALLKKFIVITLRDKSDNPRVSKRMDITNAILKKAGFKVIEINSKGKGLLSRILSLMYIGDFVSFYLAILYGINPTPVDRITYLKGELAK